MGLQLALYGDRILGRLVKWLIRLLGRTNPDRASDFCGAAARRFGPYLPAHRIGQANLRAAFPDKDAAWIEATLREAWDNLGRVAGEYVHMAQIWDFDRDQPNGARIQTDSEPLFDLLRTDGKPALCFAAHLANWELPAIAAAAHGLPSAVVYRMPNNKAVAREIIRIRAPLMGRMIRTRAQAAVEMAAVAISRRASGHGGGPAFFTWCRRHVFRPAMQGQPYGRSTGTAVSIARSSGSGLSACPTTGFASMGSGHTSFRTGRTARSIFRPRRR